MSASGAGAWVDLAVRAVGGGVVAASDETFAEKENLVATAAPTHAAHTFGHKGQIYDGWETRRRRQLPGGPGPGDPAGDDWAVIRLGLPGIVHRVVVDTAFFDGNHPVSAQVDTRWIEGHPSPAEAADGPWEPLCGTPLEGNTAHTVEVEHPRAATHVRLRIHPDGGVARLRVLGEVLPDVRRWRGIGVDLASLAAGGRVLDASNRHYSPPENLLLPGTAAHMGEGWETRRRREGGFDWVDVALGVAGRVHQVVVDTTHFVGNAPGTVRLVSLGGGGAGAGAGERELLPETPVQPDAEHWFGVPDGLVVDRVRVEVRPDGGFARLRLFGRPTREAAAAAGLRRFDALPAAVAEQVLLACCSAPDWAAAVVAGRPYADLDALVSAATAGVLALDEKGLTAALAGHARIGAPEGGPGAREQAGVGGLDDAGRAALAEGNRAYEERFGHVYLVRAAGRSGDELLALLADRLRHDPETEAEVVRAQLAEITALRIEDLWTP
ncbi:allantoicase [Actinomycetospora sp. TBRC 11914]|uniref:allantoicase n=1 Tax=Actinomycetospora sp. TBRC 11914 TaxID=2729387 RepID=UPI00145CD008|nr:allantoicase [Actinomycetospora sp. TBRC 11914]NMO93854.1 allantoicase [Actinomycetospora sp. TBRC 11914]